VTTSTRSPSARVLAASAGAHPAAVDHSILPAFPLDEQDEIQLLKELVGGSTSWTATSASG